MGEQPVEPDGDAEAREAIEREEDPEVGPRDPGAPQPPDGEGEPDQRDDREREGDAALEGQLLRRETDDPADPGLRGRGRDLGSGGGCSWWCDGRSTHRRTPSGSTRLSNLR